MKGILSYDPLLFRPLLGCNLSPSLMFWITLCLCPFASPLQVGAGHIQNYATNIITYGTGFYTPPPPTPENTLQGWGGVYKGGGMKFLPRGPSKHTPPPPSPEKCLLARNGGWGGGGI